MAPRLASYKDLVMTLLEAGDVARAFDTIPDDIGAHPAGLLVCVDEKTMRQLRTRHGSLNRQILRQFFDEHDGIAGWTKRRDRASKRSTSIAKKKVFKNHVEDRGHFIEIITKQAPANAPYHQCVVCMNNERNGMHCPNNHFICADCLPGNVEHACALDSIAAFGAAIGATPEGSGGVPCCMCQHALSAIAMHPFLSEATFDAIGVAKRRVKEMRAAMAQ